jgi:SAM-dependent methyltransferase
MLNEVTEISRLPANLEAQLCRFGEFYICSHFSHDLIGPPIVRIGENIYYRFMSFIYLPQPPESLSIEQVKQICDIRLMYLDKLLNLKLNRRIVAAITDIVKANFAHATSPLKALDFGCGSGLSSQLILEHMPDLKISGVDISKKAVDESNKQALTAVLTFPEKPLPFKTATFDLIFAIFVMHFNVDVMTLAELCRLLRPSGKFVFNVYMRDIEGVIQQLQEAGFGSFEVRNISEIGTGHMIVSCGVSAPTLK